MRLIDADNLLTAFQVDDEPMLTKSCVRMTIQHMPTVDAVEVMRCKDCKYWTPHGSNGGACELWECQGFSSSDYCSAGKRKGRDHHEGDD